MLILIKLFFIVVLAGAELGLYYALHKQRVPTRTLVFIVIAYFAALIICNEGLHLKPPPLIGLLIFQFTLLVCIILIHLFGTWRIQKRLQSPHLPQKMAHTWAKVLSVAFLQVPYFMVFVFYCMMIFNPPA